MQVAAGEALIYSHFPTPGDGENHPSANSWSLFSREGLIRTP